jgi:hypothetical protein
MSRPEALHLERMPPTMTPPMNMADTPVPATVAGPPAEAALAQSNERIRLQPPLRATAHYAVCL